MSHLGATLRNDYLRVSLGEIRSKASFEEVHNEWMQIQKALPRFRGIIIDLCTPCRIDAQLSNLLRDWRRQALRDGKQFRINGVSELVREAWRRIDGREILDKRLLNPHAAAR